LISLDKMRQNSLELNRQLQLVRALLDEIAETRKKKALSKQ